MAHVLAHYLFSYPFKSFLLALFLCTTIHLYPMQQPAVPQEAAQATHTRRLTTALGVIEMAGGAATLVFAYYADILIQIPTSSSFPLTSGAIKGLKMFAGASGFLLGFRGLGDIIHGACCWGPHPAQPDPDAV